MSQIVLLLGSDCVIETKEFALGPNSNTKVSVAYCSRNNASEFMDNNDYIVESIIKTVLLYNFC